MTVPAGTRPRLRRWGNTGGGSSGGGLTNTELRATPVPVTGTIDVTDLQTDTLTDAELRAAPVVVTGTIVTF